MSFVREKAEPAKRKINQALRANRGKRATNALELRLLNFADEFQRHVKIFRASPARSVVSRFLSQSAEFLDQGGEIVSHPRGYLQRGKKTHASGSLWRLVAVVEKMYAHHVQRGLRGLEADRFAIAGEADPALLDAARV